MAEMYTIDASAIAAIAKVRGAMVDLTPLMAKLAALGVEASLRAFQEQRLGEIAWQPRYPNQAEPFVNIAGVIADFAAGRTAPKPSRFQRVPALVDEGKRGGMWGSITWVPKGKQKIAWGTNKEYAAVHQEGGETRQTVTPAMKQKLYDYFYAASGKRRKTGVGTRMRGQPQMEEHIEWRGGKLIRVKTIRKTQFIPAGYVEDPEGEGRPAMRSDYIRKFGWLLNLTRHDQADVLATKVVRRPFLGVPMEVAEDMKRTIEEHFRKAVL